MPIEHRSCQTHCCVLHGCKYGHEDCPVANAKVEQAHACEDCDDLQREVDEGRVSHFSITPELGLTATVKRVSMVLGTVFNCLRLGMACTFSTHYTPSEVRYSPPATKKPTDAEVT